VLGVFHDEENGVAFTIAHDLEQAHDIRVLQLLQDMDLAQGGYRESLLFVSHADFFQRDDFRGLLVPRHVYATVRALADLL